MVDKFFFSKKSLVPETSIENFAKQIKIGKLFLHSFENIAHLLGQNKCGHYGRKGGGDGGSISLSRTILIIFTISSSSDGNKDYR